jgi:putative membrane-bound dehydrogenase-like protein
MPPTLRLPIALLLLVASTARGQDDLARELPRIPPAEPDKALATFKIQPGFQIVPVAVEPLVTDPVAAVYDADGRLYVVEMRGYPFPEKAPSGNVTLLDDADGDGQFDRRTIFVDGLSWPTGVVPYDGGVFIAVAPDILYAKDTDGDGKADVKRVVFTGFGTQNVQGLLNGLLWGPDGWIYGSSSSNGGEIRNLARPDAKPVSVRNRDFRFKPDSSAFEALSGGGQFGHTFDDWGHRFVCNNSNHIRQIAVDSRDLERNPALAATTVVVDIAAEGGAAPVFRISPPEPWRVVRTRQRAADPEFVKRAPPTELVATGFFTSATGVTIYRGTAFPPEYRGNAFIGDVGGNLVHRKTLTKSGALYRATRANEGIEFLASTDNWFRPVNFANTPSGTLLVLDMYRETIEHPESIPEPIKKHLDLTSGKDRGRLYEIVPEEFSRRRKPHLSTATTAELVGALADPDAWWRETAQRLLIERRDAQAPPLLAHLVQLRPSALAWAHALWTLSALGHLDSKTLLPAFQDSEPGVREQAARLSEGRVGRDGPVRTALLALAEDPDAMVRYRAAFALGGVPERSAIDALARIAIRNADDRWIRTAVLSSVAGRPEVLLDALAEEGHFLGMPAGRVWLGELAALVGAEGRDKAFRRVLERASATEADPGEALAALLGLGRGLARSNRSLRELLAGPDVPKMTPLFEKAARLASGDGDPSARAEAVRLIGLGPVGKALDILPPLLDVRQPAGVQVAALQALSGLPSGMVGQVVTDRWKALSPSVKREAVEVLFSRRERLSAMLDAIERGEVAATDLDPARRSALREHADTAIRDRAARLLGGAPEDRARVVAEARWALELRGDTEKGRAIFRSQCATCHRAEGQGAEVGPDLATVAGRSPEDLLTQILDPNRGVSPVYVDYAVATADGRVLSGLIAEETATSVTLKRAEGATDVVPRAQVESIASTGRSLMPEGLEKDLGPQALADLIAFLRGLSPAR